MKNIRQKILIISLILLSLIFVSCINTSAKVKTMITEERIAEAEEYIENSLSEKERIKAYLMLADYHKKAGNKGETKNSLGKVLVFYTHTNLDSILNGSGTNEFINYLRRLQSKYNYTGAELHEVLCLGKTFAETKENEYITPGEDSYSNSLKFYEISRIFKVPLIVAIQYAEPENVQFLIDNCIGINEKNTTGLTPLMAALRFKQAKTAKSLIEAGADVNAQDNQGLTPLLFALGYQSNITKLLIQSGADINAQDNQEWTPLLYALRYHPEMTSLLIEAGADVNAQDNQKWTPLLHALRYQPEMTKLLIEAGADVNSKNGHEDTPLKFTIEHCSSEEVKLLIKAGADVNAKNNQGQTPLIIATESGWREQVQLLIEAGADVNAQDNQGQTPLIIATKRGSAVTLLIEAGADVNAQDNYGLTPLMRACKNLHLSTVKLLIFNGAQVNAENTGCDTPLHYTVYRENGIDMEKIITLLKQAGADINKKNKAGHTPYDLAINQSKPQMILDLLKTDNTEKVIEENRIQEAKENVENSFCGEERIEEYLMLADYHKAAGNEVEAKKNLGKAIAFYTYVNFDSISYGSGINELINYLRQLQTNYDYAEDNLYEVLCLGKTFAELKEADYITTATNSSEKIKKDLLLISHRFSEISHILNNLLIKAIQYAEPENVQFLIDNCIGINEKNISYLTPLIVAIRLKQAETANSLIKAGADVNTQGANGTPLYWAHILEHTEITKLLIEAGADVNSTIFSHSTLLHLFPVNPDPCLEHFELLIKSGADLNAKDSLGRTPLMSALRSNRTKIAKFLIKAGADVNTQDDLKLTPLIYALWYSQKEMVELLIEAGADVNAKDENESTPLMKACAESNLSAVRLLISNGAQVNAENIYGSTPLHYIASSIKDTDIAKIITLLKQAGADISKKNDFGQTPYSRAEDYKHPLLILDLLRVD